MSAIRRENDFYETLPEVTHDFLEVFGGDYKYILEPCCGNGNMVRVLREHYPDASIIAQDIQAIPRIKEANATFPECDFLAEKQALKTPIDLVFTNPPYSIAEKIIRKSFLLYPIATVVMLLRLDFLGSQDRYPFWSEYPVNDLYPMACRPSFTGDGGTGNNNYGWFVWVPGSDKQKIQHIWGRAAF